MGMQLPIASVDRVIESFADVQLGDPRRRRRLEKVVAKVARAPTAHLPAALGNETELEGCYRLMNNRHVTFETLLGAQCNETRRRAELAGNVLLVHDTTDCSFPDVDPAEIGYLQTGKAGFRLHLSLVLDAGAWRRPLGIIHAETVHRSRRSKRGRKRKASGIETASWQDREYHRWWRGMKAGAEALRSCKRVIHVADREGDSYDLMAHLLDTEQRFVIRVRVDRRGRSDSVDRDDWSTVKQVATGCEGVLEREVQLSRRKKKSAPGMNQAHPPRAKRVAKLRFAATRIVIPRPRYLGDPAPETLTLNLVRVVEVDPSPDEPTVEWLLYTTEPIDSAEHVADVVDTYRARWTIEEFNAALKTGCAYEARQFESRHALLAMLALSLPVACEVLWLRSRARSTPTASAMEVLSPLQLKVLRTFAHRNLPETPTAQQALLAVAGIGGHMKTNGAPGWKVLQRGMTLLLAYEAGWRRRKM